MWRLDAYRAPWLSAWNKPPRPGEHPDLRYPTTPPGRGRGAWGTENGEDRSTKLAARTQSAALHLTSRLPPDLSSLPKRLSGFGRHTSTSGFKRPDEPISILPKTRLSLFSTSSVESYNPRPTGLGSFSRATRILWRTLIGLGFLLFIDTTIRDSRFCQTTTTAQASRLSASSSLGSQSRLIHHIGTCNSSNRDERAFPTTPLTEQRSRVPTFNQRRGAHSAEATQPRRQRLDPESFDSGLPAFWKHPISPGPART